MKTRFLTLLGLIGASGLASAQGVYYDQNGQLVRPIPMAPKIDTVYAEPMARANEIPLYGQNKGTYFYNAPKKEPSLFGDGGLYAFAAFGTGETQSGINGTNPMNLYGSDANANMGDVTSYTLGVGRILNRNFNIELAYTSVSGAKYGNYASFWEVEEAWEDSDEEEVCYDDDDEEIDCPSSSGKSEKKIAIGDEVANGGEVSADYLSLGFQYKLDRMFGSFAGGMFKPYIGVSFGIAMNKLNDYTLLSSGYSEGDDIFDFDEETGEPYPLIWSDTCTGAGCDVYKYSEADVRFIGATTNNFGYTIEGGVSMELDKSLFLEFFYKLSKFGKVSTSGNVIVNQDVSPSAVWDITEEMNDCLVNNNCPAGLTPANNEEQIAKAICNGAKTFVNPDYADDVTNDYAIAYCQENGAEYHEVKTLRNQTEGGDLNFTQFGVKLKYMF